MLIQKKFVRAASICCFLSVVTTLGIHLYFPDPPADFEERVQLYRNNIYLINRWWVIIHCLLVLVSMWGLTLLQFKKSPGLAGLGFVFIAIFAFAEITRQLFVLFYINELRVQYILSTDISIKENLKATITNAGLLTAPLFGLFILSFGLGNLCYGLSMTGGNKFDALLSALLIIWGCTTLIGFGNNFWGNRNISQFFENYNYSFQPFARAMIAVWLWRRSTTIT